VIVMMRLLILIISMKVFITNTCRLPTYCIIISNIMLFSIMSYSSFAIPCSFLIMSYALVVICLLFLISRDRRWWVAPFTVRASLRIGE
jgi:hypothetical protein